jgi:hypothetical protein
MPSTPARRPSNAALPTHSVWLAPRRYRPCGVRPLEAPARAAQATPRPACAPRHRFLAALHALGAHLRLGPLTPMAGAMTARRRLIIVRVGCRGLPPCLQQSSPPPPVASPGRGRLAWSPPMALCGLGTKQQAPQPRAAPLSLLPGKKQPTLPPQDLPQPVSIRWGQRVTCESLHACRAVCAAQCNLLRALHGARPPLAP